jgi:hypothetical protein
MAKLPSVAAYKRALTRLQAEGIPQSHLKLLRAHYRAYEHTANATHLAKLVGYRNYRPVNLQYGKFGKRLTKALRWSRRNAHRRPILSLLSPAHERISLTGSGTCIRRLHRR